MPSKGRSGKDPFWKRLQRPAPSRPQRKAILIALEDARSAKLYFEDYRDELKASRVVVIARHKSSDPNRVVAAARGANDARTLLVSDGRADPFDEVWVVFDTEGPQNAARIKRSRKAIEEAKKLGFKTAVSNPCFEYWILLHFEQATQQFQDGKAVCRQLEIHIAGYSKSKSVYKQTRDRVDAAIERAERRLPESGPEGGRHPCDVHPCTEAYRLVKSLLQ